MSPTERTFWNLALPLGATGIAAALFFMLFVNGMGMGAFSSDVYAVYERIAGPAFFAALAWIPICLVGIALGAWRKWSLKPYLVLAVGGLVPPLVFLWANLQLY